MSTATEQAITNTAPRVFSEVELASITDFDSAVALINSKGIKPKDISDYGSGFEVVTDKNTLVGVPFIILEWHTNKSDYDEKGYLSATLITKDGRKLVLNDGGTGIPVQLAEIAAARTADGDPNPTASLICAKGLRRSDYEYVNDKGRKATASTFYLTF